MKRLNVFATVVVALAFVFSACEKSVPDQIFDEGADVTTIKGYVTPVGESVVIEGYGSYNGITNNDFSRMAGTTIQNYQKLPFGVLELDGFTITGGKNQDIVISFADDAADFGNPFNVAVKYTANAGISIVFVFDTEECAGKDFSLSWNGNKEFALIKVGGFEETDPCAKPLDEIWLQLIKARLDAFEANKAIQFAVEGKPYWTAASWNAYVAAVDALKAFVDAGLNACTDLDFLQELLDAVDDAEDKLVPIVYDYALLKGDADCPGGNDFGNVVIVKFVVVEKYRDGKNGEEYTLDPRSYGGLKISADVQLPNEWGCGNWSNVAGEPGNKERGYAFFTAEVGPNKDVVKVTFSIAGNDLYDPKIEWVK